MMKPSKALGVAAIVSIAVVFLFLTSAAAPAMSSNQANAFTSSQQANLLPNPTLDANITWNTFYHGWNMIEYNNGTEKGNKTLNAQASDLYKNPISINPTDILAYKTLQNNNISKLGEWENTSLWSMESSPNETQSNFAIGKGTGFTISVIDTKNANAFGTTMYIPDSDYPSANLQYDYLTMIYSFTGANTVGASGHIVISNESGTGRADFTIPKSLITPGQADYFSIPLNQMKIGLNTTTGKGYSNEMQITPFISTPSGVDGTWSINIYGMALTTYPVTMGTNATGSTVTQATNNLKLTEFNPSFNWQEITDSGYSVAVSQPLQNITTSQSEISGNPKYIEQVTYQGNYLLPEAPDLSYSSSVISEKFSVNASQTTVLDINGLSLLNTISGKNGTITLMTVNPNQKTTLIQIVDYTSSQWESVSGPPGFFSVNGILYYFDEIVLGIIAVVGLAGGAAVARTRSLRRVK